MWLLACPVDELTNDILTWRAYSADKPCKRTGGCPTQSEHSPTEWSGSRPRSVLKHLLQEMRRQPSDSIYIVALSEGWKSAPVLVQRSWSTHASMCVSAYGSEY